MSFIPGMQSCISSIITPVFSVTWSSEIIIICWFDAHESFVVISVEFFFLSLLLMNMKFKVAAFIWKLFHDILDVFNVIFY